MHRGDGRGPSSLKGREAGLFVGDNLEVIEIELCNFRVAIQTGSPSQLRRLIACRDGPFFGLRFVARPDLAARSMGNAGD